MAVWWILSLVLFVSLCSGQDHKSHFQQVPVCASIPGTSHTGDHTGGALRGPKGDQGNPGKRGVAGEPGLPGSLYGTGGCPSVSFHFPRDNQATDYVRYRSYVQKMKQMTVCAWVESTDFNQHATMVSYAVPASANEMFVAFMSPTSVRFALGGTLRDFTVESLQQLRKVHICTWFSRDLQRTGIYINGESIENATYGGETRGGGDMILGQEQDATNAGNLDPTQAFYGNITNFMIWQRALSAGEIRKIVHQCECPIDYAIAMTLDKVEIHGEASYSILDECPTLER